MPDNSTRNGPLPTPGGHYSPAIRVGNFVLTAGQTPRDTERNVVGATIEEQTAKTMENLQLVLAHHGATFADVVKTTVHLADLKDAARFNELYATYFPDNKPVRTVTGSQLNGILVEVDMIAYVGDR